MVCNPEPYPSAFRQQREQLPAGPGNDVGGDCLAERTGGLMFRLDDGLHCRDGTADGEGEVPSVERTGNGCATQSTGCEQRGWTQSRPSSTSMIFPPTAQRFWRNLVLLISSTFAAVVSEAVALEPRAQEAIRKEIQQVIAEGHYPGISILLVHHGDVVMREAHGVVNVQTGEPFTTGQLCWLASTSKIFTGLLVAMLVDDGVLSFDDPIERFLPEFSGIQLRDGSRAMRPVLLRHALSHTTGLTDDRQLA